MSIINDALKKVQNSLSSVRKTPEASAAAAASSQSLPTATTASEWGQPPQWETPPPAPAPEPTTTPAAAVTSTAVRANANIMVYIAGAVCLLIAFFAPLLDHQSVFGLITNSGKKSRIPPATAARIQEPMSVGASVSQKAAEIKAELTRSLVNFNNPSTSSNHSSPASRITLSGILAQGGKNVALIDGQVYEAGETIDGAKIVQINANSVVVDDNGQQRTLKVGQ